MITKAQFGGIAGLLTTIDTIPLSVNLVNQSMKHQALSLMFRMIPDISLHIHVLAIPSFNTIDDVIYTLLSLPRVKFLVMVRRWDGCSDTIDSHDPFPYIWPWI